MKVSIILDRSIVTAWYQESRKETSTKMRSTGELIEIREANTSINLTKGHIMSMFNEAITYLLTPMEDPFH